jgi:hypothetical protein
MIDIQSDPNFRWMHIYDKDQLQSFYLGILPKIKEAARECGYALAHHGSLRRDLDLLAVPWTDSHVERDTLAKVIHKAACGLVQDKYEWEKKPCGRFAVSFPICWTERSETFPNETNLGHIDLSVMDGGWEEAFIRACQRADTAETALCSLRLPPAHNLYQEGDPGAPDSIKDRNGEVVLGLCKRCGRGEAELVEPCSPTHTASG